MIPARLPRAPLVAAAIAALPSFAVPFLSDDWAHLRSTLRQIVGRSPFGEFRPITQLTFAFDRALWGTWPVAWHLTNVVFVVAATALLTALAQRHLRDRALAALAGLLFALHPYHVANVAWISARGEVVGAAFFLAALLAYDRWRAGRRGLPVATFLLFEAALLSGVWVVVLPIVLAAIGWGRDGAPPPAAEWWRGLLPLATIGLAHELCLRPLAGVAPGLAAPGFFDAAPGANLLRWAAAAVVPAHPEHFSDGPSLLGGIGAGGVLALVVAALIVALLGASAWLRSGRLPAAALVASGLFILLALPRLAGFRADWFFLASAASSVALAALFRDAGRRAAVACGLLLAAIWGAASIDHWLGWRAASRASAALVEDLVLASRQAGVGTIVVANLPRRVRGAPVGMEYTAAIEALGGRSVRVEPVAYLDYPTAFADDLAPPYADSIRRAPDGVTIELLVPERIYSRNLDPGAANPDDTRAARHGTIRFIEPNRMLLFLPPPAPGVAAYVWKAGRLEPLDLPPADSGP